MVTKKLMILNLRSLKYQNIMVYTIVSKVKALFKSDPVSVGSAIRRMPLSPDRKGLKDIAKHTDVSTMYDMIDALLGERTKESADLCRRFIQTNLDFMDKRTMVEICAITSYSTFTILLEFVDIDTINQHLQDDLDIEYYVTLKCLANYYGKHLLSRHYEGKDERYDQLMSVSKDMLPMILMITKYLQQ